MITESINWPNENKENGKTIILRWIIWEYIKSHYQVEKQIVNQSSNRKHYHCSQYLIRSHNIKARIRI